MNIFVLNTVFQTIDIIEAYESAIWTDRYNAYGDFEIYAPFSIDLLNKVKHEYYLTTLESEHTMIIESVSIFSDTDKGDRLRIIGRSLESILDRRILWDSVSFTGSLQDAVESILNSSIINPTIAERRISNFIFEPSTDPRILDMIVEEDRTGDNIYDVIHTWCARNKIGFKITLNQNNQFVFKLYMGEDRSYDQLINPYVVFSPNYENIINSNYIDSIEKMKNITLVDGEDANKARYTITVGSGQGLTRREYYTDARGVDPEKVTNFNEALRQRGLQSLQDHSRVKNFEGEVDAVRMFVYGKDFFMGDIVQISNEYGIEGSARVMEFIKSDDAQGLKQYPTFEAIQERDTNSNTEENPQS